MIDIKKTYKNYVDGKYVRSESGKTYTKELKNEFYELPLTSKKDIRDAVTSSKNGYKKWSSTTPYLRMQILYRLSEMIEGNKESYIELLMDHGFTKQKANKDIEKMLKKASIPLADIAAQNMKMNAGEKSERAIKKHAAAWIKANQSTFDSWLK